MTNKPGNQRLSFVKTRSYYYLLYALNAVIPIVVWVVCKFFLLNNNLSILGTIFVGLVCIILLELWSYNYYSVVYWAANEQDMTRSHIGYYLGWGFLLDADVIINLTLAYVFYQWFSLWVTGIFLIILLVILICIILDSRKKTTS